jgi:hypothetical protein
MRDDDTKETPNLSLKQLANLFGFLKTDADDNIISIEPDYDEDDELPEEELAPDISSASRSSPSASPFPASRGNGEGSSKSNALEIESDEEEEDEVMEDLADNSS